MTPLDPTSPDVTAHAIELIAKTNPSDMSIKRGITYLKQVQETDGSWFGRWGVNYTYGTGLVLMSLCAAGENMEQQYISRALDWLETNQNVIDVAQIVVQ
jgi:squalene-hopene/tetraprenyl-beta-curcumene cyclase